MADPERFRDRAQLLPNRAGDVLLSGTPAYFGAASDRLGLHPPEGRQTKAIQRNKAGLTSVVFTLAVALSATGLVSLSVALGGAVIAYSVSRLT